MNLYTYMQDGANAQTRATLAYLQDSDGIEESWSDKHKCYLAKPDVSRWENCREQGYIVKLRSKDYNHQLNIAFFEHRNSDNICAIMWKQLSINALTIDTAKFGNVYKNKFDVSFRVEYGQAEKMAKWITQQLTEFWIETQIEKPELCTCTIPLLWSALNTECQRCKKSLKY